MAFYMNRVFLYFHGVLDVVAVAQKLVRESNDGGEDGYPASIDFGGLVSIQKGGFKLSQGRNKDTVAMFQGLPHHVKGKGPL